jgi:hypothetical protein
MFFPIPLKIKAREGGKEGQMPRQRNLFTRAQLRAASRERLEECPPMAVGPAEPPRPLPDNMATRGELQGPPGKFRVVMVDRFDEQDMRLGDFDSAAEAMDAAKEHAGQPMLAVLVYDDHGRLIADFLPGESTGPANIR